MPDLQYLSDVIIFLLATVVVVPLFQRLRVSPLIGYLLAGMLIGPNGLAVVDDPEAVRNLSELGVVVLLFTVGLELPFNRLRVMGGPVFGLGMLQMVVTGGLIGAIALAAGLDIAGAIVIGSALALSSTAVVLQLLMERREMTGKFGRLAIAVLLLQDISVGPLLVLIPALGEASGNVWQALGIALLKAMLVLTVLFIVGRIILKPLFKIGNSAQSPELNTALILLVIIGTGMATHAAGLSMALGAFVAGMMLADTEYRHEVMKDIQPFRGLLLGLFFMAVGMFIDIGFARRHLSEVAALAGGLLLVKAVVMALVARFQSFPPLTSLRLGVLLSQSGEFAFAFIGLAVASSLLSEEVSQLLAVVIALTMAVTPLLAMVAAWLADRFEPVPVPGRESLSSAAIGLDGHVLICGFGRVGRSAALRFAAQGTPVLVIEKDERKVLEGQAENLQVFKCDATEHESILAARIDQAQAVIVAIGETKGASHIVATLRYLFPTLKIIARARDDAHGRRLLKSGADDVMIEKLDTGERLAGKILPVPKAQPD